MEPGGLLPSPIYEVATTMAAAQPAVDDLLVVRNFVLDPLESACAQ